MSGVTAEGANDPKLVVTYSADQVQHTYATHQIIPGGNSAANMGTSAVAYASLMGNNSFGYNTTIGNATQIAPTSGTFSDFYVRLNGNAGDGKSYNFTVMKNSAATSLGALVEGATQTVSNDLVDSVHVVTGDTICLRMTPTNTPTARKATWSIKFVADNDGETILMGNGGTDSITANAFEPFFGYKADSTTASQISFISPLSGEMKLLYSSIGTAPGGTTRRDFTAYQNGAITSLGTKILGAAKTSQDVINKLTLVSGDIINIKYTAGSGTPAASTQCKTSLVIVPTVTGNFPIPSSALYAGGAASAYGGVDDYTNMSTTEANFNELAQPFTIRNMYVSDDQTYLTNDVTFTLRKNTADTVMIAKKLSADVTTFSVDSVSLVTNDYIAVKVGGQSLTRAIYHRIAFTGFLSDYSEHFPTGWSRRCPLTINHNLVSADLTGYPALIGYNLIGSEANLPEEMLAVTDDNCTLPDGRDIRFTANENGSAPLPFEIVTYSQDSVQTSRKAQIWVKVSPTSADNATIYVWYKNPYAKMPEKADNNFGAYNTWDSNYKAVFHFEETAGYPKDSSGNGNDVTGVLGNVPASVTGKIGKGFNFPFDSAWVFPGVDTSGNTYTLELWSNENNTHNSYGGVIAKDGSAGWYTNNGRYSYYYGGDHISDTTITNSTWEHRGVSTLNSTLTHKYNGQDDGATVAGMAGVASLTAIGGDSTLSEYADAKFDEVRISLTARSAAWMWTQYQNMTTPQTFWSVGTPEDYPQIITPDVVTLSYPDYVIITEW